MVVPINKQLIKYEINVSPLSKSELISNLEQIILIKRKAYIEQRVQSATLNILQHSDQLTSSIHSRASLFTCDAIKMWFLTHHPVSLVSKQRFIIFIWKLLCLSLWQIMILRNIGDREGIAPLPLLQTMLRCLRLWNSTTIRVKCRVVKRPVRATSFWKVPG